MTAAMLYEMYKNTWQSFVDITDVTYEDSHGITTGIKARKCIPEQKELAKLGLEAGLQTDLATFVLWDATMAELKPKGNGKITWTDGSVWTIQATWQEHFDTQWRCVCRKDK